MSLHESPIEQDRSSVTRFRLRAGRGVAFAPTIGLGIRLKQTSPVVLYRLIALAMAVGVIASHLHAESSLRADAWIIALALGHVSVTVAATRRLPSASIALNCGAIAVDMAACVVLLTLTDGWAGPFWLYAISAVFWPSARFGLLGAVGSVAAFLSLVLIANYDLFRATVEDGFGGDLAARGLMVMIVAGATTLTARSLATVRRMAIEAERNRIARDLHDGVGKTMGGISMEARSLSHWIERDAEEAGRRARYVARISERAAIEVRDVIRGLRETEATILLFPSIREAVDDWEQITGMHVRLKLNGSDALVPVLIHNELIRMVNELLTNVARHADASDVRVRLTLSTSGVTLSVRDDGRGFRPERVDPWADDGHFGLLGIRERTSMLGGWCRIASSPGNGSDITIDLPLGQREERGSWLASLLRPAERLT
jgi:signal transduction histidine kinase